MPSRARNPLHPQYIVWHNEFLREKKGWVYAAQAIGDPLVKIGRTSVHLDSRLMNLRRQHRLPLQMVATVRVPGYLCLVERCVHALIASAWIEGEWFYIPMSQGLLVSLVREAMALVVAHGFDLDVTTPY